MNEDVLVNVRKKNVYQHLSKYPGTNGALLGMQAQMGLRRAAPQRPQGALLLIFHLRLFALHKKENQTLSQLTAAQSLSFISSLSIIYQQWECPIQSMGHLSKSEILHARCAKMLES